MDERARAEVAAARGWRRSARAQAACSCRASAWSPAAVAAPEGRWVEAPGRVEHRLLDVVEEQRVVDEAVAAADVLRGPGRRRSRPGAAWAGRRASVPCLCTAAPCCNTLPLSSATPLSCPPRPCYLRGAAREGPPAEGSGCKADEGRHVDCDGAVAQRSNHVIEQRTLRTLRLRARRGQRGDEG